MDRRKVYIYKIPGDREFMSIACDCHMNQRTGEAWKELWFLTPPDRGHMIQGEVLRETKDGFIFRSDGVDPGEWTFKELTIKEFKRKFFKKVVGGEVIAHTIKTTEDLHEWYRKEFKV
ncbi:MAG: hypothetical protein WBL58_02390 [Peptococcia bacterium]|jgi:hypothetical protein